MAVAESRPAVPAVLYDVDEAAEALRLSRSVLYELIRSGRLRTVKQGRRRLVPVSALAEYVDSLGRRTCLVVPAGTAGCIGMSIGSGGSRRPRLATTGEARGLCERPQVERGLRRRTSCGTSCAIKRMA